MSTEPAKCPALDPTSPDLTDPATYRNRDYLDAWRRARHHQPVARLDSPRFGPFWSVTVHGLGQRVLDHPERFTSTMGMRLGGDPAAVRAASGRMLVVSDGAVHRRLRAAHTPWFVGRALAALKDSLRHRLDILVEAVADGEPVDIVQRLADPLPTWVVCAMLGAPEQDWDLLGTLAKTAFGESADAAGAAAGRAASAGVFAYFADLLEDRKENPAEDVVSALLHRPPDNIPLSDEEILLNVDGLVNGGLGTTRHAVAGTVLAFARHPAEWQRLRENPRLVPSAVEEVLRWASPPLHVMRTATEDTTLGTARIRAGDRVVVWIPSCNRDESVFREPDAFRVDRRPNPHLSLGSGPHYCVGASLARLELRTLVQALLPKVARIEIAGEVTRAPSTFLHGLERLEVVLVPTSDPQGD